MIKGKWKVTRVDGVLSDEGYSLYIESKDRAIADIVNGEDMDANAKRIVQMHNSHDGLLEALKDANQLLGGLPYKNSDIEELIVEGRRKLGQAIARAEKPE